MPELCKNWHIYALDVYGHGGSSHNESLYYIDVNGDDIIIFIDEVIGEPTVVAGHSNGALTAAYVEAYGGKTMMSSPPKGKNILGSVVINERGQLVIPKEARERFGLR